MKNLIQALSLSSALLMFAAPAAADDNRPPKPVAVEVGPVIGLGVNTSPLGVGPNVGLEAGVRIRLGPGFLGIHVRGAYERYNLSGTGSLACSPTMGAPNTPCISMPAAGNYTYNLLEEGATIGIPISYRFLANGHAHPYIQVQPQVVLMRGTATTYGLVNTETGQWTRGIGVLGALGFQYDLGPGGIWIEAGYRYAAIENRVTAGQNATLSVITAALGYRFAF